MSIDLQFYLLWPPPRVLFREWGSRSPSERSGWQQCETWSLTLREKRNVRVFVNRVLRWLFGPKGLEVTGEWRKLPYDELYGLYFSPNTIWMMKSRRMRWAGYVARMGKEEVCTGFLVGRLELHTPLWRPNRIWDDIIRMDLQEVGSMDWNDLPEDRERWRTLVNAVMDLAVP